MNRKILFTKINKLCLELDEKYNINNGGCCYVAYCIAKQLELHNIPFKIIHYNLFGCHYAIKVSDRYLNRSDFRKKEIFKVMNCCADELLNIYYSESWNQAYDVKHNLLVRKLIQELFNENCRT